MSPERNLDCIVGVGGSGKTSLSRAVAESTNAEYISASGILKKYYNVPRSVDLEKFSQEELNLKFIELLLDLVDENPDKRFLLDTHAIVFRDDGTTDETFPSELYPYMKAIIDVISDPQDISRRVTADNNNGVRERKLLSPEQLLQRINKSSQRAIEIGREGNFPYYWLENNRDLNLVLTALLEYYVNGSDRLLKRK